MTATEPPWQRARIINNGRLVWVRNQRPTYYYERLCYISHIQLRGICTRLAADALELLPEFADTVLPLDLETLYPNGAFNGENHD